MLKRYTFWLTAAILFQFVTALIHTYGLFMRPEPANETERQLVRLMKTYELAPGMGFSPTYAELLLAMGMSFTLLLLLAGLANGYLLFKHAEPNLMRGILAINVAIFGVLFLLMLAFAFFTPVLFTGLIFFNLLLAYITAPRIESTI